MDRLRAGERDAVAVLAVARARQADDQPIGLQVRLQIVEGQDSVDARYGEGGAPVDLPDMGVGVGAADVGQARAAGLGATAHRHTAEPATGVTWLPVCAD